MAHYRKVVVGLTTIPARVSALGPVLDSIAAQTRKPDELVISVSRISARENKPYPLDELEAIAKPYGATVHVIDTDYGPLTKLMGLLLRYPLEQDQNDRTLLITVDDDHAIHPTTVAHLIEGAEHYPDSVLACNGLRADFTSRQVLPIFRSGVWMRKSPLTSWLGLKNGHEINLVMGYGGVAYPRAAFGPSASVPDPQMEAWRIKDSPECVPRLHNHDDLYISTWLDRLGVVKVAWPFPSAHTDHKPLPQSYEFALCAGGDGSKRDSNSALKHGKEWTGLVRRLQEKHGLKKDWQMEAVPLQTDIGLMAAGATVLVLASAGLGLYLVLKSRRAQ